MFVRHTRYRQVTSMSNAHYTVLQRTPASLKERILTGHLFRLLAKFRPSTQPHYSNTDSVVFRAEYTLAQKIASWELIRDKVTEALQKLRQFVSIKVIMISCFECEPKAI